jgi:hypothetical protein|tara:strand:+ start:1115 stop:1507 length:393 start_codon:yes stop_codon:yes gene_type:complete
MGDTAIVIDNIEISPIGMSSRNMNKASSVERECPICLIETNQWREMPCCNNNLCPTCYDDWHGNSQNPTCVFCRYDDIEYVNMAEVTPNQAIIVLTNNTRRLITGVFCFLVTYATLVVLYFCEKRREKRG